MAPQSTQRPSRVPVLLYHAVTDAPGGQIAPFTVAPAVFVRQLDVLLAAGFRCLTFGELIRAESAVDRGDGDRIAVITFDDGYADFAEHALPALRDRSLASTLYLTTGWLEGGTHPREPGPTDPMLSFDQLPDLMADGVELGAHSHSHPQLDTLSTSALREELSRPKKLLEDTLGCPITTFAYPHGYSGPRVRRLTRQAGYESAAGVRNALHGRDEDTFAISRLTVTSTTSIDTFTSWLHGPPETQASPKEAWQTKGWRAYRRTRALVSRHPGSDYR